MSNKSVTPAKRVDLVSLRMVREGSFLYADRQIRSPRDAFEMMKGRMVDLPQETVFAVCMNAKRQPTCVVEVSRGDVSSAIVNPADVYRCAVMSNACSVLVLHNHPSGSTDPSGDDWAVTKRLRAAGTVLGVELVDHLVVAGGHEARFVSLRELRPDCFSVSRKTEDEIN